MTFIINILSLGIPFSVALLIASLGECSTSSGIFNLVARDDGHGSIPGHAGPLLDRKRGRCPGNLQLPRSYACDRSRSLAGHLLRLGGRDFQGSARHRGYRDADVRRRHRGYALPPLHRGNPKRTRNQYRADSRTFENSHARTALLQPQPAGLCGILLVPPPLGIVQDSWGLREGSRTHPRCRFDRHPGKQGPVSSACSRGALAGLAGAPEPPPSEDDHDEIIAGRGFIRSRWSISGSGTVEIWAEHSCSTLPRRAIAIQGLGIDFPYEFLVMLPYLLVIIVLAFSRKTQKMGPTSLGKPFNREMRT
jgi:simple sugar transport system permease protein